MVPFAGFQPAMVPSSVQRMKRSPWKALAAPLNTWPVGADAPVAPAGAGMVTAGSDELGVPVAS